MDTIEHITAYQLSKNLNEDYRVIRKMLADLNASGAIEIVGHSDNSSNAPLYGVDDVVKSKLASMLQARKGNNATACNNDITRELKQLKDLQAQAVESANTIKSLNDLVAAKDKELQQLTNEKVMLDADFKIAQNQLKMITDKSNSIESENAKLQQEITARDKKIHQLNRWLVALGAMLIIAGVITICYFLFSR